MRLPKTDFDEQYDQEVAKELKAYSRTFKYEFFDQIQNGDNPIMKYLETVSPRAKKFHCHMKL